VSAVNENREENEVERALRVAREKVAHWEIESVEKKRKFSDTLSIARRVTTLLGSVANFYYVCQWVFNSELPEENHPLYPEICGILNGLTEVYNSIHCDVKDTYGLGEKFDKLFPVLEEIQPTKSQIRKRWRELGTWTEQLIEFLDRKLM
jgi:hypothetical protein